ncbi:MAG: DNA alkylation repair protein [Candidatus Aenigmarchaeota archaeon]|nr:DNA alkylation repair protein [Candidatus Aenigmarchaeota archaeon]
MSESEEILGHLRSLADPAAAEGMKRFGINPNSMLGVSVPKIRKLAKEIGKDHTLAQELWASGIHEARILASMVDDAAVVTGGQMELWVRGFDSWDVCDQCCGNLFDKTAFAYEKAAAWSSRKEEFVRRAGFALMACLAVHDKKADDRKFLRFLGIIKRESGDGRNFVRKAVNWALRQIGKRNARLHAAAIETAEKMRKSDPKSARWIAADALRELRSGAVRKRLARG